MKEAGFGRVGGWCVWWGGVGDPLFGVVRGRPPTTVSPMSPKVVAVGPLDGFRVWVRFDDGTSGDIDLAHLAELPMYEAWHDPNVFATVRVGEYGHDITWYTPPVDVDLVAHWLYTEITGVTFSELMERPGRFTHWQIKGWAKWFRLGRRLRPAHPEAAGDG